MRLYTGPMICRLLASSLIAAVLLAGCHSGSTAGAGQAASPAYKVYKLRRKVVSTDAAKGEVTLNDGTKVSSDGTVTSPGGKTLKLNDGDSISMDGRIERGAK